MSDIKLKVLISDTFDPWFNMATEDFIFRDMLDSTDLLNTKILYLWRNDKTVVIGRFQNPWKECNTQKMEEDGIKLARRQSGGGAVYHDLGNTNFTFLSGLKFYDKNANNQIITKAVNSYGLGSYTSGRNDLVIRTSDGEKKFSGSAFKETKDRSFHHGTLLINSNLSQLSTYLNPSKKKLETKGITSVKSRVVNLHDLNSLINHADLQSEIIKQFCDYYQSDCEILQLDHKELNLRPRLKDYFNKMSDWNWRFGESPEFNHYVSEKFSWGEIDVHFEVLKAFIVKTKIFSDSLHPEMIEALENSLNNIPYTRDGISLTIDCLKKELPMIDDYLDEFKNWILCQIS